MGNRGRFVAKKKEREKKRFETGAGIIYNPEHESRRARRMNENHGLKRVMTLWDATLLVIGSVIGSGIFMTTGIIVEYVKAPGAVLLVWLAGGLITLFGALAFG